VLPSNLLLVYKHKGEIQPRYAKISPENLQLANQLIEIYKKQVGEKKKNITPFITKQEQNHEYRFVRALALLLDRKSQFICNTKTNPQFLRKKIFQTTEKQGLPTTTKKRQQILETVALELSLNIKDIEEQMYADLDAELFLEKFEAPTPTELLQQYNLSLTQTLLFESNELTFTTSGNWQQLFYQIKKLGLIYEIYQTPEIYIKIDGPSSLFKLTKRYGTNIAKLLPTIITNQTWTITAKILWKYTNEICTFEMNHTKHNQLLKTQPLQITTYDSTIEETFANQFKALNTGWTLKREPEPIPVNKSVLIPDFSLEKSNLKIYLEIIGFWTEDYLQRKTEKLKHVNTKMILLIHENLACEKITKLENQPQLHFIYYKDKIPLSHILQYLQKEFETIKTKEIQLLQKLPIIFTEPIINYTEFANQTGLSIEAIQQTLTINPPKNYIPINNGLISQEKLQQIATILDNTIKQTKKLTLTQATTIIETQGVNDTTTILKHLNYKIKWNGINTQQAEIIPPKPQTTNEK